MPTVQPRSSPRRVAKERPILFSAPMVRALLAGAKTQTRRQIQVQPPAGTIQVSTFHHPDPRPRFYAWTDDGHGRAELADGGWCSPCRYGQPGDRLWVREAWKAHTTFDHLPPREIPESHVWYMADHGYKAQSRYRQGMFMPRWASRITLEITGVRIERLQDISRGDAMAEGCPFPNMAAGPNPCDWYRDLWEQINGAGSWAGNPWVWVVKFKRVQRAQQGGGHAHA